MKKTALFISMVMLLASSIPAQESAPEVFAPFVSRINVKEENGKIIITWKNSDDVEGYKQIFRHTEEITETNISRAQMITRVGPSADSFIDTPPANQTVFYAVLLEASGGGAYVVLIPFRNKTAAGIKLAGAGAPSGPDARITGLLATVSGNTVIIQFTNSQISRDIILYRSTKPILTDKDLTEATYSVLVKGDSGKVNDAPVAGIDYYYAMADALLVQTGKAVFVQGESSTIRPVQIPISSTDITSDSYVSRGYPLPAPNIMYGVESGKLILPPLPFLLPMETDLSETTIVRVDSMIQKISFPKPVMTFETLPLEASENTQGEDKTLRLIVTDLLQKGLYDEGLAGLDEYISTAHEKAATSRAFFYRGQTRFFLKQYKDSLLDFVMAEEINYLETQKWIAACFENLPQSSAR
ncbi:MAG: hypothetical protein EHM28_10150 [Spirochaetaceae bacterium]|nr:MAG: hypothetical protein EHM28_10150 [Spirochaetaceae bacterium]